MSNIDIDIDKFYVSPYDKFLRKFDATHELTESQIKEIEKHQRIAHQRDHQLEQDPKDKIWADF
jgi:hypothetical protein